MRSADREVQRQVYRQASIGEKLFIPAKPKDDIFGKDRQFRVCAYCRVSTDKDDQRNSFEAQKRFFDREFEHHSNWTVRTIFADKGISGTSLKKRDEFNCMIADAMAGANLSSP